MDDEDDAVLLADQRRFHRLYERGIDHLLQEEVASSAVFREWPLATLDIPGHREHRLLAASRSVSDRRLGESDVEIEVQTAPGR